MAYYHEECIKSGCVRAREALGVGPEPTPAPSPEGEVEDFRRWIAARSNIHDMGIADRDVEDICRKVEEILSAAVSRARASERERCADIADQHASVEGIAQRIADEIRRLA